MKGATDMLDICIYFNQIAMDNEICSSCKEFMTSCLPIIDSIDGYSSISECSHFLCSGCNHYECLYRGLVNI